MRSRNDFKYLSSYVSSTEKDVNIILGKMLATLNAMNKSWSSNLTDKLTRNFFRAIVESVLIYIWLYNLDVAESTRKKTKQKVYMNVDSSTKQVMDKSYG